ncbi:hypothetical protein [Aeromonas caviae]|uniref:hypothetical protein n=1 Tax=Aeromonas caviae TaxID=648 RepID=UPI00225AB30E|nr:hypothetical protein [Aeromonas caviae]MCX4030544.1 hypothetical protein [Aeromonas caviae]
MEIEKNKFFARKSITRSAFLLIVCTPLLLGVILKLFYYLPKDGNPLSDGLIGGIQDLASKFYHDFEPIQYIWLISPTPSVENLLTVGNVLSLVIVIGFLWGIASFQVGVSAIDELSQAKRNARKRQLEDEYRNR